MNFFLGRSVRATVVDGAVGKVTAHDPNDPRMPWVVTWPDGTGERFEEDRLRERLVPKQASSDPDPVNHPRHYCSSPSGVECIEVAEHMTFNIGNAVKYLWRAGHKGNLLEDLKKSRWYVSREIERLEKAAKGPR